LRIQSSQARLLEPQNKETLHTMATHKAKLPLASPRLKHID
jgi:hypothetical protein